MLEIELKKHKLNKKIIYLGLIYDIDDYFHLKVQSNQDPD